MLQTNEIQQRMSHIRQSIGQAEQVCQQSADASPELKQCIHNLADRARQADDVIKSNDQSRIVECVDSLEDMGDDAKRMSRSDAHISPQLETAVTQVHAEISDLKHKLH